MTEVFFGHMVPHEVVRRRQGCPVAYLPVGVLEWHGVHLPFGTDYMTVEYIAERAASEIGGVAFPPIYYGDMRYMLQEHRTEWRDEYVKEMSVPSAFVSNFPLDRGETPIVPDEKSVSNPLPFSPEEQRAFFVRLIAYTLLEIYHYGFRAILLLPGHGPNAELCVEAEKVYAENAERRASLRPAALVKTVSYIEVLKEVEPLLRKHWIHADKIETSIMRIAQPDTVHHDILPKDPSVIPPAYLGFPYLESPLSYSESYRELWSSFEALDPRHSDLCYADKLLNHILKHLREEVRRILRRIGTDSSSVNP